MEETIQRRSPDRLGTAKVGKLLLEFSIPAIISMIFNALYNVIDSIFLGQAMGSVGIAVTTLAMPIMIVFMGLSMLAGQGGNALAAILLGERKHDVAERTLGNTFVLLVIIAAFVALCSHLLITPLLSVVGTTEELYDPTKLFVQIISAGYVFQCVGMGLNNFIRTAGRPNLALFTMVFGTAICIVLNYLFVMVLGWGIAGSAWATVGGQACGMVPVLYFFTLDKRAPFRLHLACMKPDFRLQGRILLMGTASFVMQVAMAILSVILNRLLVYYGSLDIIGADGALSGIGVANKVSSFAFMPVIGVNIGAQPIIGYNFGAHLWKRVQKTFKLAAIFATSIIVFFFILIHLIPIPIVNLFGVTGDLEDFTVFALKVMTLAFPVIAFQAIGSGYFQSSGQPVKAMVLSLTRQILFLIPLLFLLPVYLPHHFDVTALESICFAYPLSDFLALLLTTFFVIREMRKLSRLQHEQACREARKALSVKPSPVGENTGTTSPDSPDNHLDTPMTDAIGQSSERSS